VSENQMFRNLAGNPQGRGERLRDGGKILREKGNKHCNCN
jgi:hypothetical protein